jgi:large subunit ribosomal protein L20
VVRVKRGNVSHKRHKKLLRRAKGFYGRAKLIFKTGKPAVYRALGYATRDRRARKREFRSLWISRIHAGLLKQGLPYSRFVYYLNHSGVRLNRKTLAYLAATDPMAFEQVVKSVLPASPIA